VPRWPLAPLLLLSCSRPNPAFLEGAGASTDMSSGTGTTDLSPTTAETPTTGPVPETSSSTTTGDTSTGGGPLCPAFVNDRVVLDPPLPAAQCAAITTYYGKISKPGEDATVSLCGDAMCSQCIFNSPVDPALAPYLKDGSCLKVVHQGEWRPGDPEAGNGCKTVAAAIYDDDTVYPLYAASSRVTAAPSFIDSDVRMDVARDSDERCRCAEGDCCLEGQASHLRLNFTDHGADVGALGPGEFLTTDLKGATYVVAVLRAHIQGYVSTTDAACVADPETHFIDWHMLRVLGP
jgi:hypothetical protein